MSVTAPLQRPLHERLLDRLLRSWPRRGPASLRGLDKDALADIGVDASEIDSIEAEARGRAPRTRRRVVGA